MSLQVWLPLNGDLHNQGLSNLIFVPTSYNTVNNNGKIGKCYNNNAPSWNRGGILSDLTINLGIKQSMFCWVNFTTLNSSASLGGGLVTQHNASTNSGMSINIRYVSSTTGYATVSTGNGSSRTYKDYYGTTLLQAGTWYHLGYTYDGTTIKIYVNGHCEKTQAYANMAVPANKIGIFGWSLSNNLATYALNGKLNDVRIYDHCLSAKEVEEIAKGLVLHYKLDDAYIEGTHNYMSASQSMPNLETQVINDVSTSGKYWNKITIDGLGTYTFSVYIKNTTNKGIKVVLRAQTSSKSDVGNYIQGNLIDSGKEGWSIVTVDLTTITNAGGVSIKTGMWLNSGTMNTLTSNPIMGYMQLEKNDHRTPWTLGGTTRAASTIVYDSSGYQNNGTITGSLTCNDDSPRYSLNTNFNAYNNYITVNNFTNTLKNITNGSISWWQKGSQAQSLLATGYSGTGGTYFIMATNSSKNFYHQNSGTITVYKNGISGAYKITVGEWDFYCITGVDLSTWSTFRLNYYSSTYHVGSISDLRIYATILTESQIQELYNTSTLIDKNGNVYPRELVEK